MENTLNEEWRRVASTHNLQDLLNDDDSLPPMTRTRAERLMQQIYGLLLIVMSIAVAAISTWILVIHYMPLSDNYIIRAIQQDWHYCCLIPLTLPVAAFVSALDWFLLKLLRHNE